MITIKSVLSLSGSCTNRKVLLHKVGFVPELCHGLEHQGPAAHPQQTCRVVRVGKHSSCTQKPASVRELEHWDLANRCLMAPLTSFVTVCQFLRDPLDGFGSDFSAEVSIKRWWSSSLWGETTFKIGVYKNILQVCVWDLLHVAEDVLPAVKHSSALLAVQLVDEVSGEVHVAVLVSETQTALKAFIWVNFLSETLNYGQINPETLPCQCIFMH